MGVGVGGVCNKAIHITRGTVDIFKPSVQYAKFLAIIMVSDVSSCSFSPLRAARPLLL